MEGSQSIVRWGVVRLDESIEGSMKGLAQVHVSELEVLPPTLCALVMAIWWLPGCDALGVQYAAL